MSLREQVSEFHRVFDQPIVDTPTVPSDERVRLRARLIAEEFFEVLESLYAGRFDHYRVKVLEAIDYYTPMVKMVELADGLADLDYVVEGTRLEFGVSGEEIAAEVHRANLAKASGPMREDGKRLKPEGWQPPDIVGELRKQGWLAPGEKAQCVGCGSEFNLSFCADPYASEINGDDTPAWHCESCLHESAQDI